jgi:hypothetical protein
MLGAWVAAAKNRVPGLGLYRQQQSQGDLVLSFFRTMQDGAVVGRQVIIACFRPNSLLFHAPSVAAMHCSGVSICA